MHTSIDRQPLTPAHLGIEKPQLEIPSELRGQIHQEDLTQTETGLLIPSSRRDQIARAQRGLFVPESANMENRVLTPDEEMVKKLANQQLETQQPKRPLQEILILSNNPNTFIAQEVMRFYGANSVKEIPEEVSRVLATIKPEHEKQVSRRALLREEHVRFQGKDGYPYTVPGPFETVAIRIAEAAADPDIRDGLGDTKGAETLTTLLKNALHKYRLETKKPTEFLPELPDLVDSLLKAIDNAHLNKKLRYMIYDCLEQITIPTSKHEDILWKMDEQKDLSHPLAFQLTSQIMIHPQAAESSWLIDQQARYSELRKAMEQDAQTLFDSYPELRRMSKQVVMPTDPLTPITGKIGLEFEYSKDVPITEIPEVWDDGFDINPLTQKEDIPEMRRSSKALDFNAEYIKSLNQLAHWFRDNAEHLSSMHIHLDLSKHPFRPLIGEVLGNEEETIKKSIWFKTWEVRGLIVPSEVGDTQNRLSAEAVTNAIVMYIEAANNPANPGALVYTGANQQIPLDQLTFGHIVQYLHTPEGRLAALKALQHPLMLRAINPEAIQQSYSNLSQKNVLNSLMTQISGNFQKDSIIEIIRKDIHTYKDELIYMYRKAKETNNETDRDQISEMVVRDPVFFKDFLNEAVQDKDDLVRNNVVRAWKSLPTHFKQELQDLYAKEESVMVRATIIDTWASDPEKFQNELRQAISDPDEHVRKHLTVIWSMFPSLFRQDLIKYQGGDWDYDIEI